MKKNSTEGFACPGSINDSLTDLLRAGAKRLIEEAINLELQALLKNYSNVTDLSGRQTVVRNGYLPEREILTGIGPVSVQVPKVRDRSGNGVKFNSALVPPYIRKAKSIEAALPWLYLKGISTGDMQEALSVLVGEDAKGLSPSVVCKLKAQWSDDYQRWNQRDLSTERYVYVWADGIYSTLRGEEDKLCLLVMIGVNAQGEKRLLALSDGYRESKASWLAVIQDLQARGLQDAPKLAIGDGALGFWAAQAEAWPETRCQRCWFHKTGNVLNELPKSLHSKAKDALHEIWMAETKVLAEKAFDRFERDYGKKYPKATEKLTKDRDKLLSFYDFPAEHWQHIRTTNPIESTFATIRHRTTRTKNCVSRLTLLGLVFQMALTAEKDWRRISGFKKVTDVINGVKFQDGIVIVPDEGHANHQQQIAA